MLMIRSLRPSAVSAVAAYAGPDAHLLIMCDLAGFLRNVTQRNATHCLPSRWPLSVIFTCRYCHWSDDSGNQSARQRERAVAAANVSGLAFHPD